MLSQLIFLPPRWFYLFWFPDILLWVMLMCKTLSINVWPLTEQTFSGKSTQMVKLEELNTILKISKSWFKWWCNTTQFIDHRWWRYSLTPGLREILPQKRKSKNHLLKDIKQSRLNKNSKPLKRPRRNLTKKALVQITIEASGRLKSKWLKILMPTCNQTHHFFHPGTQTQLKICWKLIWPQCWK